MNLIYRASESTSKFQANIINKLLKDNMFDKCIVISRSEDIKNFCRSKKIKEISSIYAWEHNYTDYLNENNWNPLSREILENMLPYESTILELTNRDTNFDCYTVKQAKEIYYNNLKFWNHIIDTEEVNIAVFNYIPHVVHEYLVYCLCKIKNIPCLVFSNTHIPSRYVWGDSIENVGSNLKIEYNKLLENKSTYDDIDQDLQDYINKHYYGSKMKTIINKNKMLKNVKNEIFREVRLKKIVKRRISLYRDLLNAEISKTEHQNIINNIRRERKNLIYTIIDIKSQVGLKYFDNIAKFPDYTSKYIYFALQLQPEATTVPGAGVFGNQILSLEILSKCAENLGIKIYVKEHWVQPLRKKEFYMKIRSLKNVELIKSSIPSEKLISHALAVSTQTGSCIIEGILRYKNSLVFGKAYYWRGAPGVFEVGSVKECTTIIEGIMNGKHRITKEQLMTYFKAINNCTIVGFTYSSELVGKKHDFTKMENDLINVIENFILNINSRKEKRGQIYAK